MRAIVGWVWAACLLAAPSFALGQGITSTPPRRVQREADAAQKPESGSKPSDAAPAKDPAKDASKPPKEPPPSKPLFKIELHGGAWLFYYQPFQPPEEKPFLRMHVAHLNFDGSIGDFGLFFNASARDTRMREFYEGPAWLEEGYFYYKHPKVMVKVGKSYSRFGLFWDNSFFGPIHFYDGIKLDPNYGISIEGTAGKEKGPRLGYFAQYFLVDGRTNGSYVGRDTISIPGARRRNIAVLRLEPAYHWNKDTSILLGVSGQYFQADIPALAGTNRDVLRFALDYTVNLGPVSAWGEASRQLGQSVTEWPIPPVPATATTPAVPGRASAKNDYLLVGGEARIWKFVARYNLSAARFHDVGVTEYMHQPGLGYNMNDYLQFLVEYAHWTQHDALGYGKFLDQSVATTIHGYF
ncbi:hypothetical protein [Polyangium mundeleinium]|uniref:Alginate export domain-containing protein n=1 Tax=Polyangium mundeleinium TaxID=2995306 RepID=A0ABT5F3V4_9BACT|nr:hypothetical protein [Polyangium mundeleinium]MDC0748785.1 hypothetical protein [Polyangium mundeleinium]